MFKKELDISEETKMTPKDRKTFKQNLQKFFDKESVDATFLNVDQFFVKKPAKSKMVFYFDEEDPLFVDSTSKKDYFPTVYAVAQFPKLVKFFLEVKPNVEKVLSKGGKLMWDSVTNFKELPSDFSADELIGIKNSNNEVFGVGALACDANSVKDKQEGMAAFLLHYVGDTLFVLGAQKLKDVVFDGKVSEKPAEEKVQEEEENDDDDMMGFVNQVNNKPTKTQAPHVTKKNKFKIKETPKNTEPAKVTHKKGKKGKNDEFEEKEKIREDSEELKKEKPTKKTKKAKKGGNAGQTQAKEMDNLFVEAFLNAVTLSVDDRELPMDANDFFDKYILPNANPEHKLDIKNTTFKKKGKFFSYLDKQGYIDFKESTKKSSTPQVEAIHRMHKNIENWEPTIFSHKKDEEDEAKEEKLEVVNKITNICVPDETIKKYIGELKENQILTKPEFEKLMRNYLKKEKLLKGEDVLINEALKEDFNFDVDFSDHEEDEEDNEKEDKEENEDEKHKQKKVHYEQIGWRKFIKCLEKHLRLEYQVLVKATGTTLTYEGEFKGPTIFAEKSHNKFQTRILGLNLYGLNMQLLLETFKKKFNTHGTLMEAKGDHALEAIVLQGTFFDEVKDFLVMELKFKEEDLILVNKIAKKKKKETVFK